VLQAPPPEYRSAGPALLGTPNNLSLLLGACLFETTFSALAGRRDVLAEGAAALVFCLRARRRGRESE
jgi:hypothetical protein